MTTFSFYDPDTGEFSPARYSGPDRLIQERTPAGLVAIEGRFDCRSQRFDLAAGEVVSIAVAPLSGDMLADTARKDRDERLSACDWVVSRSVEAGEEVPLTWREYRQALRDVPDQPDFPTTVTWPEIPA